MQNACNVSMAFHVSRLKQCSVIIKITCLFFCNMMMDTVSLATVISQIARPDIKNFIPVD
jgi:hypothetical protein